MASGVDASTSVKRGNELVMERWRGEIGGSSLEGMREADDVFNDIVGLSGGSGSNGDDGVSVQCRFEAAEQIMNELSIPQTKDSFSSRECSNVCCGKQESVMNMTI